MKKTAKLKDTVKLYPHQQRVVDDESTSKILAHQVGSGKTLTGIAKFEKLKEEGKASKAVKRSKLDILRNARRDGNVITPDFNRFL